jgi:hypothetical protein
LLKLNRFSSDGPEKRHCAADRRGTTLKRFKKVSYDTDFNASIAEIILLDL